MSAAYTVRNTDAEVRVRGRVGTVRQGTGDRKVVNISVAFQRSWPTKDENGNTTGQFEHKTQWYEFACWEGAADRAKGIGVGDVVEATFNMADVTVDLYEKNGEQKSSLKVGRSTVLLLSKKDGSAAEVPAEAPVEDEAI